MSEIQRFIEALERSLKKRYDEYREPASPDTVLLAVLNAVADARHKTFDFVGPPEHP